MDERSSRCLKHIVRETAAGRAELVRTQRDALQRAMEPLVAAVEWITRRTVRTFLSGTSTLGESSVEVFVLEPDAPTG